MEHRQLYHLPSALLILLLPNVGPTSQTWKKALPRRQKRVPRRQQRALRSARLLSALVQSAKSIMLLTAATLPLPMCSNKTRTAMDRNTHPHLHPQLTPTELHWQLQPRQTMVKMQPLHQHWRPQITIRFHQRAHPRLTTSIKQHPLPHPTSIRLHRLKQHPLHRQITVRPLRLNTSHICLPRPT